MTSDGRADCTHDRRYYALILLATFASPRRGEATALRRCDLDLDAHVRVRPAYVERSTGECSSARPSPSPVARRLAGTAVMAAGPTVIEDVCVRPGQLAEMLAAVQEVSAGSGIPIATVAHAGDGNLHPVLMLPDLGAETVARAMAAGERLCDHARLLGGTITGGARRRGAQAGLAAAATQTASLAVHQAIKTALDPAGILNPGRSF